MKYLILYGFAFVSSFLNAQKPIFITAKTKSAVVYFNGAELTQNTSVNLPAGSNEIVIKNVANSINESTIQIGAPASVTILSVQFTNNYISEFEADENNPILKKVLDSIVTVQKELKKIQIQSNSITHTIALLDNNQLVGGANSGLNVAELIKLVEYYKGKRIALDNIVLDLQEKEQIWIKKLQFLKDKLEFNTKNTEKPSSGKLILQVMNSVSGNVPLTVSYITNTATWAPFYDLRADNIANPINVVYKAQIIQNSGIDWKRITLTLSSGLPNQNTIAPELTPWFLSYLQANNGYLAGKVMGLQVQNDDDKAGLKTKNEAITSNYPVTTIKENQLTISFDIDIPYDIASNGKIHSVVLKELKIQVRYNYYAAPRIEKEAFLMAKLINYSNLNFLAGEANIIFEGTYVGKTLINPNQTSDTLSVNMGRDKRISMTRTKLIDTSGIKFLSSYKEQIFSYEITVRNNKKESILLLLKDQYPVSTNKEITVELLQNDGAKIDLETGILLWNLNLGASETKKIRLSYKVKYPKDQTISNL